MSIKNYSFIIIAIFLCGFVYSKFPMLIYFNEIDSNFDIKLGSYELFAKNYNFANYQLKNFAPTKEYAVYYKKPISKIPIDQQEDNILGPPIFSPTEPIEEETIEKSPFPMPDSPSIPDPPQNVTDDIWDDTPPPLPPKSLKMK